MEKDLSKHILVPEHTKATEEEKKAILEKYNVSIRQMPKILEKDPAIKHLDIKAGDLIKIRRASPTNKETIFYRVVVHG